jgi:hypothetical protein
MAKKKKDLDVNLDTANVDVKIVRKDGKTKIDIDTKIGSVDIEKDSDSTKVELVTKTPAGATVLKVLRAIKVIK